MIVLKDDLLLVQLTSVLDIVPSPAQNLEGTTEVKGVKTRMKGEKDLDRWRGAIGTFLNGTHRVKLLVYVQSWAFPIVLR